MEVDTAAMVGLMTHLDLMIHALQPGGGADVAGHNLVFHLAQAGGSWLFIFGAAKRLELHVVPGTNTAEQRDRALAEEALAAVRPALSGWSTVSAALPPGEQGSDAPPPLLVLEDQPDANPEHAIARATRSTLPVSVLFIDLDGFKQVNDTLGHQAGDRLLQEVAVRLTAVARGEDTVARHSGDEFVMVCEHTSTASAVAVARRLVRRINEPCELQGLVARVNASVGVATSDTRCDAGELLRRADAAMYRAKERGPGSVEVHGAAGDRVTAGG